MEIIFLSGTSVSASVRWDSPSSPATLQCSLRDQRGAGKLPVSKSHRNVEIASYFSFQEGQTVRDVLVLVPASAFAV